MHCYHACHGNAIAIAISAKPSLQKYCNHLAMMLAPLSCPSNNINSVLPKSKLMTPQYHRDTCLDCQKRHYPRQAITACVSTHACAHCWYHNSTSLQRSPDRWKEVEFTQCVCLAGFLQGLYLYGLLLQSHTLTCTL